jgi:Putative auto-transporter adhesin, head GIN domain
VSGDPELVSHVKLDGDDIKLDCGKHRWNQQRLDITLPGNKTFREIDIKGVGTVTLTDIDQPELEIGLAGKSDVTATGKTDSFTVSLAGKGDVHAKDLIAQKVEINIAGHGDIETSPIDSADISIAGHGVVKLFTEPKHVETSILGHGDVEHMAPKG